MLFSIIHPLGRLGLLEWRLWISMGIWTASIYHNSAGKRSGDPNRAGGGDQDSAKTASFTDTNDAVCVCVGICIWL